MWETVPLFPLISLCGVDRENVFLKSKIKGRKLRIFLYWQGALKKKALGKG
jgi:hypothetical protein